MSEQLASLVGDFVIRETAKTVAPASNTLLCGPDPTRWALELAFCPSGSAMVVNTNGNPSASNGKALSSVLLPLIYNFRDHGPIVNVAWFGNGNAGSGQCLVTEILYRPSVPTIGLDDVMKEFKKLRSNTQWTRPQIMELLRELQVRA